MKLPRFHPGVIAAAALLGSVDSKAAPLSFSSTLTFSSSQPTTGANSISNWTGAAFDAQNIGGSGTNSDGGADNGTANDVLTVASATNYAQGQTFTTGAAANGYDLTSVTVRAAGYTNNAATSANYTTWNLAATSGPIRIRVGKVVGTNFYLRSIQYGMGGGDGNPGAGSSANGPGTYLTFNLAYPVHLDPNTTYGFDISAGSPGTNTFELLGINTDAYTGGSAYIITPALGGPEIISPKAGDRVFQVNMTATATAPAAFVHPGALHTPTDLARMKTKVAAGAQPWTADWNLLTASKYAQLTRTAAPVASIIRQSTGGNYSRSQEDAVTIYHLALRYHITGDTTYADKAVSILNAWGSTLTSVTGDSNAYLGSGIVGYQFAYAAEMLSTYPGWAAADRETFKNMMVNVFYTMNDDFLWRHNNTYVAENGNTHYRLNWDTSNMSSMMAIGVLCDNRAMYNQALDYFKNGIGNGRIERATWYLHPGGLGQTEEIGRDQGHNLGGIDSLTRMCEVAWNQGDDLYGYDNNRLLRALESNAKYNLFNDVPYVYHRDSQMTATEFIPSDVSRGNFVPAYEQVYNHYVNRKGLAAPYSKQVAALLRPEVGPDTSIHPSQVDWLGFGTLTFTRDPIANSALPGGLRANWSDHQITLSWWGSAYATGYNVKRASVSGGPYAIIGTVGAVDLAFVDTAVTKLGNYYYVVSALNPDGESANSPEVAVNHALVTRYDFDGTTNDSIGGKNGVAYGSPSYATGHSGQAISLNGTGSYVKLPAAVATYQDLTIGTWVYWNGGSASQRIFDIGSEIEKCLWLTPNNGSAMRFQITTTRGNEGSATLDTTVLPTAQWVHVAVTINAGTATLYVNGVPKAAAAFQADPLFSQVYCYIGKSQYPADPLFNGRIDDFRIYNYALSGAAVWNLWAGSTDHPPVFANDLLTTANASVDVAYGGFNQTLAGTATDPDAGSTLTYSKVTGPAWLAVAANGTLTGTPAAADLGLNTFVVRVADASGATDDATLRIQVVQPPSPPGALAANVSAGAAINLTWTGDASDFTYNVKRATVSGGPYTTLATVLTNTAYADATASGNTTYYYVVTAANSLGESANSNEAVVIGGSLTVTGFNPGASPLILNQGGVLYVDNASGVYAAAVTRASALTISGGLGFSTGPTANEPANLLVRGSAAGNTNDSFGPLFLNAGPVYGKIVPDPASNTLLTFDSIARNPGTQLAFDHQSIGASALASPAANTANVVFTAAPTATLAGGVQLVGSGGTGTGINILPFAFINDIPATYDDTYGLRALNTGTEMATLASGMTVGQNAKVSTNTAINAATSVNSLWGTGGTISGTGTLGVTGGAVVCNVSYTIGNAKLDFGSAEGQVHVANTRTLTINSVITGSGGLTVGLENYNANTANLILGGANTYTGITTLSGNNANLKIKLTHSLALQNTTLDYNNYGASLQFGNGTTNINAATFGGLKGAQNLALTNSGSGGGNVVLTTGGDGDNTSYNGVLSGAGGVVKTGAGILTLKGASTYTGATTVNGGALLVTGSLASGSAVTVAAGGTLGGTGTVGGAVSVANDGKLAPGGSGSTGTLNIGGNLNLSAGSVLNFDLGGPSASDKLGLANSFTPPASGTVTINLNSLAGFAAGTYSLIAGAPGISAASFVLGATPAGYTYALNAAGGALALTVTPLTALQTWRLAHFGTTESVGIAADTADPDGDGVANTQEFAAGTDPLDAASVLRITGVARTGNDMVVQFSTVTGKIYRVDCSTALAPGSSPWTAVQDQISGTGGIVSATDTGALAQGQRFYRVVVIQ